MTQACQSNLYTEPVPLEDRYKHACTPNCISDKLDVIFKLCWTTVHLNFDMWTLGCDAIVCTSAQGLPVTCVKYRIHSKRCVHSNESKYTDSHNIRKLQRYFVSRYQNLVQKKAAVYDQQPTNLSSSLYYCNKVGIFICITLHSSRISYTQYNQYITYSATKPICKLPKPLHTCRCTMLQVLLLQRLIVRTHSVKLKTLRYW